MEVNDPNELFSWRFLGLLVFLLSTLLSDSLKIRLRENLEAIERGARG
jgi:hypothetical protein